jgi:hypothetical protein
MSLHLLAEPIEIASNGTGFRNIEIQRVASAMAVDRWQVTVTVPLRRDSRIRVEIGNSVLLKYPRWGWDAGRRLLVVGIEVRPATRRITFTLWG